MTTEQQLITDIKAYKDRPEVCGAIGFFSKGVHNTGFPNSRTPQGSTAFAWERTANNMLYLLSTAEPMRDKDDLETFEYDWLCLKKNEAVTPPLFYALVKRAYAILFPND